jgi:hypothetical protein
MAAYRRDDRARRAFVKQTEPAAVEEQDLHRVTALAEEDKQRAGARIATDTLGDDARPVRNSDRRLRDGVEGRG